MNSHNNTLKLEKMLNMFLQDENLSIFYPVINQAIQKLNEFDKNKLTSQTVHKDFRINQLYIDHNYYNYTSNYNVEEQHDIDYRSEKRYKNEFTSLAVRMHDFTSFISSIKKGSPHVKLLQFLCSYKTFEDFLCKYLTYKVRRANKNNYVFKLTSFCTDLGEAVIKMLVSTSVPLKELLNCFHPNNNHKISTQTKKVILDFIDDIFTDKKVLSKEIINDAPTLVREMIATYFKSKLILNCHQNTFYDLDIKQQVLKYSKSTNIDILNKEKSIKYTTLGYYIIDIFEELKIVKITDEKTDTNSIYQHAKLLYIDENIINNILFEKDIENIWYSVKHFEDNEDKTNNDIIHENFKIHMQMKKNNYLHEKENYVKLSVDTEYLLQICYCLGKRVFDHKQISSLYNLPYDKIKKMQAIGGEVENWINDLLQLGTNFTFNSYSPSIIKENLNARINESNKYDPIQKQLILNYKDDLFKIIDQLFQRKFMLTSTITECIRNIYIKYIIVSYFYDTRGRKYPGDPILNITTNPYGKLFLKLHKENDNETSIPTTKAMKIIHHTLKFKHLQDAFGRIPRDSKKFKTEQKILMYKYILSYLDVDINTLQNFIEDISMVDLSYVFEFVDKHIKKPKDLFYVYNLIYNEQLIRAGLHNDNLCNAPRYDSTSTESR